MQMNPSFSTERMTNEVFSKSQPVDISCPQGMVPIHRTKVEGQTHLRSFSEFNGGSFHTFAYKLPGEYVSFNVQTHIYIELGNQDYDIKSIQNII
jgi:hypothetical protein